MHSWLSENLDILLERDPALASRVMHHPALQQSALQHAVSSEAAARRSSEAELPVLNLPSPERLQRMLHDVQSLPAERPLVVFGMNLFVGIMRAAVPQHLVIVEPSLSHFVAVLARQALLPLTLNGRLYIGSDLEEVETGLCTYGSFSLYRNMPRYTEAQAYFSALEQRLVARSELISERFEASRARSLVHRAPPGSPLAQFLESLPPDELLTFERVRELIEARGRPWSRVERLFMALECFK